MTMYSEQEARCAGYTKAVFLADDAKWETLALLVEPDTDLDSRFKAYCRDGNEFLWVNGWMLIEVSEEGGSQQ